jgi:hypothetical protein
MKRTISCLSRTSKIVASFSLVAFMMPALTQAQNQISGEWTGQWTDAQSRQGGQVSIFVTSSGNMLGQISNGGMLGTWQGQLRRNGRARALYTYPAHGTYVADGNLNLNGQGQLVGRMNFAVPVNRQLQLIGVGDFQLSRRAAAQNTAEGFSPNMSADAAGRQALCTIYPTLCSAPTGPRPHGSFGLPSYGSASPVYPVELMNPSYGSVIRGALAGLPSEVRRQLFPGTYGTGGPNSGMQTPWNMQAIDQAIGKSLATGVVPLLSVINGTGPGGSAYVNQAAENVMNGNSLIWKMGYALSPQAQQLERSACAAKGGCR